MHYHHSFPMDQGHWIAFTLLEAFMFFVPQVNNINQPLEISAISSPEQSSRSPTGPDMDQPPVLKRECPLELKGAGRYSSAPSSDDDDSGYPADSSSSR